MYQFHIGFGALVSRHRAAYYNGIDWRLYHQTRMYCKGFYSDGVMDDFGNLVSVIDCTHL